jgi:hypothetical protein
VIFSEEPDYGWGVGKLPMPREVFRAPLSSTELSRIFPARPFFRDLPWRSLLWSSLITINALLGLAYLDATLPPFPQQPFTSPVKIVVRWHERPPAPASTFEMTELPPPIMKPPEEQQRVRTAPPVPKPKEQSVQPRTAAERPVTKLPLEEAKASPDSPTRTEPDQVATPKPDPPRADRTVRLDREETALVGPVPDLRPRTERPSREQIPTSGSVVMGGQSDLDLATGSGTPRQYSREHHGPDIPQPAQQSTMQIQSGQTDLALATPSLNANRLPDRDLPENMPPADQRTALLAGSAAREINPILPTGPERKRSGPDTSMPIRGVSFDYLDRVAPADLDRNRLLSLNQLSTCRDPQAEMKLRTSLATLVSKPGTCRSGGVVFAIHQPESAWSVHVDIYNYENVEFRDRCAALQMALGCYDQARR